MKKISVFMIFLSLVLIAGICVAQETPTVSQGDTPAAVQPVPEKPAEDAVKPAPVKPKAADVRQPAAAQAAMSASPENDGLTLLEIAEGDFRYMRIQGMTFQKKAVMAAGTAESSSAGAVEPLPSKGKWKVWGLLVFVICITFFLYKFGNKKRRGKVLRRFPK